MNRFEFLKNYKGFACYVRYRTARVLYNQLTSSSDSKEKLSMMLMIIEELTASTEDLAMWLLAVMQRNDGDKLFRDEWERLLEIEISSRESKKVIDKFIRLRTLGGFLGKLDFPSIKQITKHLSSSEQLITEGIKTVKFSIDSAIKQRKDRSQIMTLIQNKIKHGMMVYTDQNPNKIWMRIFSVKYVGKSKGKRLSRRNRNVEIPIDVDKAERMVGTIKAYGQAIEALINLLLIDYKYKILSKKIRLKRGNREKCLDEILKALS